MQTSSRRPRLILLAGALGLVTVVTLLFIRDNLPPAEDAKPTPAAWHHDVANNRHWNPEHGHWHDGPPPGLNGLTPGTSPATDTPSAWEFDAANNRHWHPEHNHWHDGPPPVTATP